MLDLFSEASTLGAVLGETRGVVGVVLGTDGGDVRATVGSFLDSAATASTAAILIKEMSAVGELLGLGALGVASLKAPTATYVFAQQGGAVLAVALDPKRPIGELESKLLTRTWAPDAILDAQMVNRVATASFDDRPTGQTAVPSLDDLALPDELPPLSGKLAQVVPLRRREPSTLPVITPASDGARAAPAADLAPLAIRVAAQVPPDPAPAPVPIKDPAPPQSSPGVPIGRQRNHDAVRPPPVRLLRQSRIARPPSSPGGSPGSPPSSASASSGASSAAPTERALSSSSSNSRPHGSVSAQVKSVGSGPVFTGDLEEFCLPDLLEFLRNSHRTGLLVCTTATGLGTIQLSRGMIIGADSPNALDLREHLLACAELLPERRRALAALPPEAFGDDVIDGLLGSRDLVSRDELEQARVARIYSAFREMMRWKVGRFSFDPGVPVAINPALALSAQSILMHIYQEQDEQGR